MRSRFFLIAILSLILAACSEEFTETIEIGTYNTQSFQTEAGIDFLLTGAYSALDGITGVSGGWQSSGDNWWMDVVSDDAHEGSFSCQCGDDLFCWKCLIGMNITPI